MCGAPIFFPSWNVLSQAVCPPPSNRAIDKLQRVFVHFQLQLLGSSSSLRKIYLDATISRRIATGTHSIHCLAPMIMCCTKFRLSTRLSRYRVDITRDRFQAHHAVSSYIEEQGGSTSGSGPIYYRATNAGASGVVRVGSEPLIAAATRTPSAIRPTRSEAGWVRGAEVAAAAVQGRTATWASGRHEDARVPTAAGVDGLGRHGTRTQFRHGDLA
jgi:hypothetical protein